MGPLLADESHPKTLEEFVSATTPPRTKETFDEVIVILEPQRMFIEAHLLNYKTSHENWQRWAIRIWNAVPTALVRKINEVYTNATFGDKKPTAVEVDRVTALEQKLTAAMQQITDLEKKVVKVEKAEKATKVPKEPK